MEQTVRYALELHGKLYVIENVPARVNIETGEHYFSPETVERLHDIIIRGRTEPVRIMETPVFEYAAQAQKPSSARSKGRTR